MNQYDQEKEYLLKWFERECNGFRNAKHKREILTYLIGHWSERKFREMTSELKKMGHVSSTTELGYWFNPLQTNDRDEILAEKQSASEMKFRALQIIEGCDKRIRQLEDKIASISYQPTLGF